MISKYCLYVRYYLKSEYGSLQVNSLLSVLPPSEDFDGLITELEDNNLFF